MSVCVCLWLISATNSFADGDAQAFQNITLQQIMGRGWNDFERTFAALSSDPRNDQAFQEMSVVIGEAGALNKIGPYLEQIVKQRPTDKAMRTILGRVYKDLIRDPVRAKEQFEEVLKQDPNDFFCHYQLGAMLSRDGERSFEEASRHFREAVAKVPSQLVDMRSRILKELGEHLYSRAGDGKGEQYAQEAYAAWDAMTAGMRRFDLPTYEEVAGEYRARSLWPKVQETYERYLKVLAENNDAPDNVTRCRLKTMIAEACEHQGRFADAVAAYTEATALLDENTWQRRKLESRVRICKEKLNESAAHEAALVKAAADNPNSVAAKQALARVLIAAGRNAEGAKVLEDALTLSPRNMPVLSALESTYRKAGMDPELAATLQRRIKLSPEDFSAYIDLADLHVRSGRTGGEGDAEKVLAELEATRGELPEKFLLLARAYARYGMPRRAFVLYQRLVESGGGGAEQRFEFCGFCLMHEEFAPEARTQADKLCREGTLTASGYARLAEVFATRGGKEEALSILAKGLAACAKLSDGTENKDATFTLNMAMSDLQHRAGHGHRAAAIGSTLKAMLAAPDLHFKQVLNDRLITLLTNYGHRHKLLYTSEEESGDPKMFGGLRGAGIAPWVDFLNTQANSREDTDLWMLLGQIHETVEVDAELGTAPLLRRIKTDLAQARLGYEKVIDMEFQNIEAHRALARVLADPAVDEYEKAINELEVISLLNPVTKWSSMQAVGDLYALAGETAKALEKWQAVADQSASEPDLLGQVAMRMFRGGNLDAALDFAQRTAAMSPYVFRNRASYANLLGLMAASHPTAENLSRHGDEVAQTLKLAQTSPGMNGFVPRLARELFNSRVALARLQFVNGNFKAAKDQYDATLELLKKTPWKGGESAAVDVQV
ncbi:MAG: hypothetical protein FWD53_09245, partial [Phycisphaerales bacterium]|nr:hypothetical protein [Phycisphaerales bacterium]